MCIDMCIAMCIDMCIERTIRVIPTIVVNSELIK